MNTDLRQTNNRLYEIATDLMPKLGEHWNKHNLVTLTRYSLNRIMWLNLIYQQVIGKPGVICEFGVQWGASLAQLINLRGMYEPYNYSRKIIGFDTFEGFPSVDIKDGGKSKTGDYAVEQGYEEILAEILTAHEQLSPNGHMKKFELVKGDASVTVAQWLEANPHAIIVMAIFDMDLYRPTRDVLEQILPRLTKGSVLVFDELNFEMFPGETRAVDEVLGLNNLRLHHWPHQPHCAYAIYGE